MSHRSGRMLSTASGFLVPARGMLRGPKVAGMRESERPDTLNDVGVLKRREIEARIVAPLLARLGDEFGRDRVRDLAAEVIVDLAKSQGATMAQMLGGNDLGFLPL